MAAAYVLYAIVVRSGVTSARIYRQKDGQTWLNRLRSLCWSIIYIPLRYYKHRGILNIPNSTIPSIQLLDTIQYNFYSLQNMVDLFFIDMWHWGNLWVHAALTLHRDFEYANYHARLVQAIPLISLKYHLSRLNSF